MEVAVAEEKKKIFRARKTMKISDRQQLETLHSTLLSSAANLPNPSPPPMLNGRHKEDGHKTLDKERHDASDSHSQAMSPASPASRGSPTPSLSLNLSPSPPICQSPRSKEDSITFPTSPFRSLNFDHGKSGDGVMQGSPSNGSSSAAPSETRAANDTRAAAPTETRAANDTRAAAPTETRAANDTRAANIDAMTENKKDEQTTAEPPATDSLKESGKNSVLNSSPPTPPPVRKVENDSRSEADSTQDMDVVGDTTRAKNSTAKTKTEKPSSPKPSPSPSTSAILMKHQEMKVLEPKEEKKVLGKSNKKDMKDEVIKDGKEEGRKGAARVEKMEVDFVKVEAKKEKKDAVVKNQKSFRPSSTPPTETDIQEKSTALGLKRALSEGEEKEKEKVERDGKRPKIDGVELEAQLELKFTAKAGSRLKLEKVVQQLVEDRLRVLQLTVFDQNLQELKDRVEKIDSATKHQSTLNTLQAKISRLTKKFGEANQALENKRKQEVLAAAAASAATASAAAAVAVPTPAAAAKAPGPSGSPLVPRLLRRHSEEPGTPREGLAPSGGKTPTLSLKKKKKNLMMRMREKKAMMQEKRLLIMQEQKDWMLKQGAPRQEKKEACGGVGEGQHIAGLADRLASFSEGDCRADVKLRPISSQCEKWVYERCRGGRVTPRADRYASYLFRNLVHYKTYCDWVLKVNYVGVLGKDALPMNLRKTMRTYIEKRFTELTCDHWREIRDSINEILRVERRPEFFGTSEDKIASKYAESSPESS